MSQSSITKKNKYYKYWENQVYNKSRECIKKRAKIAGTKIFNDNENIDYKEFKEAISKEMNLKGIKQNKKYEIKKFKFWINIDVVIFVTEQHKDLRLANPHWNEESIANRILVSLPDIISSELSITCQNSDWSSIIFGLDCIQKIIESRRQVMTNFHIKNFCRTLTQEQILNLSK